MARKSLIPAGTFLPEGEAENQSDAGLLGRIVRQDAVKHGRVRAEETEVEGATAPQEAREDRKYDKSYSNMTSHTDDNQELHPSAHTDSGQAISTVRQQTIRTPEQPDDRQAVLPAGQTVRQPSGGSSSGSSIRSMIQATIQQAGQAGEVLKTVTIKLAPSLDRRVEEHCFRTGRKKQEVVRDALLLYFEAIEEAEEAGE